MMLMRQRTINRRMRAAADAAALREWLRRAVIASGVKTEAISLQAGMSSSALFKYLDGSRALRVLPFLAMINAVEALAPGALSASRQNA